MAVYINWNGKIVDKNTVCISPDNRSFRYGDGFFETMKVDSLNIHLDQLHFERFFQSLKLLQFYVPEFYAPLYFQQQIQSLLLANNHTNLARVRLMVYRGEGAVYDLENNHPNFVIQSWSLDPKVSGWTAKGLSIDIYRDARKAYDAFSAVKSNNYLSYLMAAFFVTNNNLHDAIILNPYDRIAESTIANVFIVQNDQVKTPPLTEGCINGVFRKYLLTSFANDDIQFSEEPITVTDLLEASEVFLTNAISGIRWVQTCNKVTYKNNISAFLHSKYSG